MVSMTTHNETDQTHNGWANRETWCMALHLSNDHDLYRVVLSMTDDAVGEAIDESLADRDGWYSEGVTTVHKAARRILADAMQEMVEDVAADIADMVNGDSLHPDGLRRTIAAAILDTGSLYRVEWFDIADGYVEEHEDIR